VVKLNDVWIQVEELDFDEVVVLSHDRVEITDAAGVELTRILSGGGG